MRLIDHSNAFQKFSFYIGIPTCLILVVYNTYIKDYITVLLFFFVIGVIILTTVVDVLKAHEDLNPCQKK